MPEDHDAGGPVHLVPGPGVAVDAQLHVEIDGARVRGTLRAADAGDEAFEGWGGLIGAVLALAGHETPPPLTPQVRAR